MTKLSVLMSARNAGRTISLAVRSTLFSMPRDSELLVLLDDCSDDSLSKLRKIRDSRIRIIVSDHRLGINRGRNLLLQESVGDFVAIMDADDICLPWRFLASFQLIKNYDAVFGTAIIFGSRLRPLPLIPQIPLSLRGEAMLLALSLGNPLVHSTALIRKDVLTTIGGYSDAKSEDYELWLRMQNNGLNLARSWIPFLGYRFHQSQASQESGFMNQVLTDKTLTQTLGALRSKLAESLTGLPTWSSEAESAARSRAYEISPLLRLEHKGLPGFFRRWKERSISKTQS